MAYRLKTLDRQFEIDLARHVRTQAGVRHFGRPIGALITDRGGSTVGKHIPGSLDLEARELDIAGADFGSHVKRLDELMKVVGSNDDFESVDENAWNEVAVRLDAMSKIAKEKRTHLTMEKREQSRQAASSRTDRAVLRLKGKAPRKVKEFGAEWAHESAAHTLALAGVNFAISAASLIGAQSSEHFVEAFHKIAENPAVEIGVTTAVTLLISAFIARIRKALKERKDKKIAKAREELFQ